MGVMMLRAALFFGCLAAHAVGAAELREPRPLLASEQPAAACGAGRAYGLLLRQSDRPDVGPYSVPLAGYSQGAPGADRYAPYLLRMDPGAATRITLRNGLIDGSSAVAESEGEEAARARNAVNLHTHGLYTAARNAPPCDLGDFSLFALGGRLEGQAMPRADYRIALPATLPGAVVDSPASRIPYPPGMAWFHAHVHGTSRDQVTEGMAGMITVGDPRAILPPALRPLTDVRHLALRDIQLTVPDCPATGRLEDGRACRPGPARMPGAVADGAAIPARFGTGEGEDATLWDATLCGVFAGATPDVAPSGSVVGPGFCAPPRSADGQPLWLFTVNGQWMPDITLRPGRATLLRVANLSASVSYVLQLGGERLRVLAADGVVAGEAAPQGPGVLAERLLMMPGARAEILVDNQGARRAPLSLTLRSAGLAASREPVTKAEAEPATETPAKPAEPAMPGEVAGDVWPAVDLARVVLPVQEAGPALRWPVSMALRSPGIATAPAVPVAARTMPGCSILPPDNAAHRWHRRITFSKTGSDETERFQMGMRVLNQHGEDFTALFPEASGPIGRGWDPEAWEPHGSAAGQHAAPHHLICPVLGRPEVWVVANASPELHNLHLHQGRFRLARPGDPGAPEALAATGPITDPTQTLAGLFSADAARQLAWHDSLPVAPYSLPDAAGARVEGTTTLYIPFFAAEQEGLYPVHCHILEHEDKGMMAAIMVLPGMAPPSEGSAAATAPDEAAILAALLDPNGRLPATCLAP